jgi:D-alanyl-lipoteichoic acid acyltransferase DltB (MBOAT superfamily)
MLFDTPAYLIFLPLVVLVYWRLARREQNLFLLAASYFFYGWWDWRFLFLIATSTVVDFYCARFIAGAKSGVRRRALLTISLLLNFGFLGFFKYFNFFVDSAEHVLHALGLQSVPVPLLRILLPPGISFYTFQAVAYIVDVYHDRLPPAESLADYALFISLFPHLIAGPIQRPFHLLPQVQKARRFENERFFGGLMLILTGLFRKCVIADNCALLANAAFGGQFGPPSLLVLAIGVYAFAWQIYGDFSGYSDIARGSAQLMGFHFMVNFRQPYLSASLQEFWRRWHISLSEWLRDYVYFSIGGLRKRELNKYRNVVLTMLIGGLWHGANWTFAIWGGLHGMGLAVERFLSTLIPRFPAPNSRCGIAWKWISRIAVFHLVCLSWAFFRAKSVADAWRFLGGVTTFAWRPEYLVALKYLGLFSLPMLWIDLMLERRQEEYLWEKGSYGARIAAGLGLLLATELFAANQANAFIYFRF